MKTTGRERAWEQIASFINASTPDEFSEKLEENNFKELSLFLFNQGIDMYDDSGR